MPRIISTNGRNNIEAIKKYFCSEYVVKFIAEETGMDYDTLISGEYKILLEPIAYYKFQGVMIATTATEAALYDEVVGGQLRYWMGSLTAKNLPLSMFLETPDLGYPAWSGPTNKNVSNSDIKSSLGLGIVRFEEQPEEPEQPPAIQPGDVYTPSETTGEYLTYSNQQIPIYAGVERNRFSQGDFMWDPDRPDRLIYTGDDYRTRFGIDVSAYQNRASANNTIDWEAAKADGVEFAMVRIGLRGYGSGSIMEDAFYAQNIDGAMAAGIETGVYFFAQAITVEEAIEEADFVISLLEGHEIDGPVAYDWEMHDSTYRVYGTTPEMATACAVAFCERIEEAGYDAMVYAGQYVSYIKYDQGALEPYLSWYPEYKSESSELLYPTLYYHMDYWQYSSKCSVAGIGGNVDVNLQFIRR